MSRGLLHRLLLGLAPWVAALVAMSATFAGLKAVAEWRASTAVAAAEERTAEERALREAQVGEAADGEGYWGPSMPQRRKRASTSLSTVLSR